jgi:Polysaccharide deacetylase
MFCLRRTVNRLVLSTGCVIGIALTLLSGCAKTQTAPDPKNNGTTSADGGRPSWMPADPPVGFFIPSGLFKKSTGNATSIIKPTLDTDPRAVTGSFTTSMSSTPLVPTAWVPTVHLYASSTTESYLKTGGLDAKSNVRIWELFLRKYKIPFQLVTSVERLEAAASGVLLLPSSVALSAREKQAVVNFRAKGGSVLASWLVGVRGERGEWLGFNFMESALDARVVGNTQEEEEDNFIMPYGDSPITHHLPAGQRIWMEIVKETYPLRLLGRNPAAQIMDWSRTFTPEKIGSVIVFDERAQATGRLSRSVVLGYPERLWLASDPKSLEAIAHNALTWLLRQPDAYIAAWPQTYQSAVVFAIDASDVFTAADLDLAKILKDNGMPATYYTLTEIVLKSASILKQLQTDGYEIAYLADRFIGFRQQSPTVQAKRLETMRQEMRNSGLVVAADAGFHAPMDSYDKTTEQLLSANGFGHFVSFTDTTDSRLPFIATPQGGSLSPAPATVVLPRTLSGPEDAMEVGDADEGLKSFLSELELSRKMAALSVVRLAQQSFITKEQWDDISNYLKLPNGQIWMATAGQVADWWRERDRVSLRLESDPVAPLLSITIKGSTQLKHAVAVYVNLPESGARLRLVPRGGPDNSVKIATKDAWRSALILQNLVPGTYRWHLYFDRP